MKPTLTYERAWERVRPALKNLKKAQAEEIAAHRRVAALQEVASPEMAGAVAELRRLGEAVELRRAELAGVVDGMDQLLPQ